jgi:DNA-binding protein Fis
MLLEQTGPNQSEAARVADLDRGHLRRLLARYELSK